MCASVTSSTVLVVLVVAVLLKDLEDEIDEDEDEDEDVKGLMTHGGGQQQTAEEDVAEAV